MLQGLRAKIAPVAVSRSVTTVGPDAPREDDAEPAARPFEGFADDEANLTLNRQGTGAPQLSASSSQAQYPPARANDGNVET